MAYSFRRQDPARSRRRKRIGRGSCGHAVGEPADDRPEVVPSIVRVRRDMSKSDSASVR
jgi:hypothetical protein